MFKVIKQSVIDWQVLKDGKPFAWITNHADNRMFTVTFRHDQIESSRPYTGFAGFAAAKSFATT